MADQPDDQPVRRVSTHANQDNLDPKTLRRFDRGVDLPDLAGPDATRVPPPALNCTNDQCRVVVFTPCQGRLANICPACYGAAS